MNDLAPGLVRTEAGYWLAPESVSTSYPADGNDACLVVEEESFWFPHRNRAILAAVERYPSTGGALFDLGAGNGYVASALERAGFPIIAIEPSRAGAANAVARGVTHVVCGCLPSRAFRPAFLHSLRPHLQSGGRLYATTPAFPRLWSSNDVRSGHYRRYTLQSLCETLSATGFTVDYATYIFWWLPLPILLFRALRSDNSQARARRQHRFAGGMFRRAAEASFAFEARRIARGASIPFGGSCLVVATMRPAPA